MRLAAFLPLLLLTAACGNKQPVASTPPAPAPQPQTIRVAGAPNTIPEGTQLEVRTNEAISSSSSEGRTYSAQIATDVVDQDGKVLLPKGSAVELILMEKRQNGGVRGSSVQVGMRSVTVNGATYLVISEEVKRSSGLGANRRTAEMVGGGAALGTAIGAAAGGSRGAVIGGLAGAAAGALVQILNQGKQVTIPAETVLTFRLDEPVSLQPAPAARSTP